MRYYSFVVLKQHIMPRPSQEIFYYLCLTPTTVVYMQPRGHLYSQKKTRPSGSDSLYGPSPNCY